MIFNYSHDYMNHMMGWVPSGWILLILGGSLLLLFVIILLLFSRSHHQENFANSLHHGANINDEFSKKQTRNYQRNTLTKEIEEKLNEIANFCSNCGEKLDEKSSKYCPFCGSKI